MFFKLEKNKGTIFVLESGFVRGSRLRGVGGA